MRDAEIKTLEEYNTPIWELELLTTYDCHYPVSGDMLAVIKRG